MACYDPPHAAQDGKRLINHPNFPERLLAMLAIDKASATPEKKNWVEDCRTHGRVIDLSKAAAQAVGISGVGKVKFAML